MHDGDAILRAIIREPADDAARLVYADWLDENGQPARAEFIRVQVELAVKVADEPEMPQMERAGYRYAMHVNENAFALFLDDRVCRCVICLQKRERELWSNEYPVAQQALASAPFACLHLGDVGRVPASPSGEVRRGFVESVTCTAADWLAHGDAIRAAHPVTRVVFTDSPQGQDWWDHGVMLFLGGPPGLHHERWPGVTFELSATDRFAGHETVLTVAPGALINASDLVTTDAEGRAIPVTAIQWEEH